MPLEKITPCSSPGRSRQSLHTLNTSWHLTFFTLESPTVWARTRMTSFVSNLKRGLSLGRDSQQSTPRIGSMPHSPSFSDFSLGAEKEGISSTRSASEVRGKRHIAPASIACLICSRPHVACRNLAVHLVFQNQICYSCWGSRTS